MEKVTPGNLLKKIHLYNLTYWKEKLDMIFQIDINT